MDNDNDNLFEITFDLGFVANAVTAQLQIDGTISDTDRVVIEYLEHEDDHINVIARKIEGTVN